MRHNYRFPQYLMTQLPIRPAYFEILAELEISGRLEAVLNFPLSLGPESVDGFIQIPDEGIHGLEDLSDIFRKAGRKHLCICEFGADSKAF